MAKSTFSFANCIPKPQASKQPAGRKASKPKPRVSRPGSKPKVAEPLAVAPAPRPAKRDDGMSAHDRELVAFSKRLAAARRADGGTGCADRDSTSGMSGADRRLVAFARKQAEARRSRR